MAVGISKMSVEEIERINLWRDRKGLRLCWYRQPVTQKWTAGFFHGLSLSHDLSDEGEPCHWPCGLIEDDESGAVRMILAGHVTFRRPDNSPEHIIP